MRCDYQASLLARNLASPYFGREPKARVSTNQVKQVGTIIRWLSSTPMQVEFANNTALFLLSTTQLHIEVPQNNHIIASRGLL
jgi:hypothetical protein